MLKPHCLLCLVVVYTVRSPLKKVVVAWCECIPRRCYVMLRLYVGICVTVSIVVYAVLHSWRRWWQPGVSAFLGGVSLNNPSACDATNTHTHTMQFKPFPFTVITVVVDIADVKLGGQMFHTFWGRLICIKRSVGPLVSDVTFLHQRRSVGPPCQKRNVFAPKEVSWIPLYIMWRFMPGRRSVGDPCSPYPCPTILLAQKAKWWQNFDSFLLTLDDGA